MKLSSLLQKIENYYRTALRSYQLVKEGAPSAGYYMPDTDQDEVPGGAPTFDEGEYPDLVQAAQQVSDPNLSSELMLIAEMYKKAIEIGGGYNSINRAISNVMNMYLEDEDDPQQAAIEDLLNNVVGDLRMRAGGTSALNKPDSPQVIAQLKKFKDEYNDRAVQEELDDLSQFDDKATQVFDPTGGMGREEAQKGSGRGYSVKTVKSLKDWGDTYQKDKNRFVDLKNAELEKNHPNKDIISNIDGVLSALDQLIINTNQANRLQQEVADDPDPNKKEKLQALLAEIKTLKEKRKQVKQLYRRAMFSVENAGFKNQLNSSTDPRARKLYEAKIKLNDMLESRDKGKEAAIKLQRQLVNSMSGGSFPGPATEEKMKQDVEAAWNKRIPLEKYYEQQAQKIKEKFESGEEVHTNIYGREHSTRMSAKDIEGLLIQFKQSIASIKMGIKKKITADLKSREDTDFKPYKEKIQAADAAVKNSVKGSPEEKILLLELKAANAQLFEILNSRAESDKKVKDFKEYSLRFTSFIKNLQTFLSGKSAISMSNLIGEGDELIVKEKARIAAHDGKDKSNKLIESLTDIVSKLKRGDIVPNKQASQEIKMNAEKRRQALLSLIKKANNKKASDEISNDINLANIEDSKEYADAVFDKMLENLQIEGLDF